MKQFDSCTEKIHEQILVFHKLKEFSQNCTEQQVVFKKIYKSYFDHFLIGRIVFLINMKNAIK